MKLATFALAAWIPAATVCAQELSPDVLLLSRVKNHIKEELHRLTNISCIETVLREQQPPKGNMRQLDTVRLEVITNGHKELFASPGDRKFTEQEPVTFAGSGWMQTGLFGPYLKTVLLDGYASIQYKGEEQGGGRVLARYDYRIPAFWSGQTIRTPEGSGKVSLRGSFWVDKHTYNVIRLELAAYDFPPELPVTEARTDIVYASTNLAGGLELLLPEAADLRVVKDSGEIGHNRIEFTHCRVFGAESTINFSDSNAADEIARFGVAVVDDTLRPLPAGLNITVRLRSRISDDMAVGALIDAAVAGNVYFKRKVIIPSGSPVRGRIRRLERYTTPFTYWVVGLEFTEVDVGGIRHLFYADSVTVEPAPGVQTSVSTKNRTERSYLPNGSELFKYETENLTVDNVPGVATFFWVGRKLQLPEGLRTVWRTRARAE